MTDAPAAGRPVSKGLLAGGIVALAVAFAASLTLVLQRFGAFALPGCGEGSGCADAANSVWGSIPGLGWPLSSVGTAWFGALLVMLIVERGRLPEPLRYFVRMSVLGSVVLVAAMFTNGYVCSYCLAVHAANAAFWLLVEFMPSTRAHPLRAAGTLLGVFAIGMVTLIALEGIEKRGIQEQAEQQRTDSVQDILQAPAAQRHAFTGRYHYGPLDAAMHIVMFTDYQCPDCQKIELQVERIFRERDDVSLSIKHFPFCTDCNTKINRNLHPNSCKAARAAEIAGLMGGSDAFWRMHFWLFSVKGLFDDASRDAALLGMGLDPVEFRRRLSDPGVEADIQADIAEAVSLGLYFTPMIFINGRQLRGVARPNVLYDSIQELAGLNPQPEYAILPDDAKAKYIGDWREQHVRPIAPDRMRSAVGPDTAPLQVLVWGDYMSEKTTELDQTLRQLMEGRTDISYTFRHYPVNPECNEYVSPTTHPLTCRAHRAVAAAGRLGGHDGYWAMHRWVLEHQDEFSEDRLRAIAPELGLDPDELLTTMDSAEVQLDLDEDIRAGAAHRFRGMPSLFINGKHVPRIWLDDDCILDEIFTEVLGEPFNQP